MNREDEYIKSHCTEKIWEELNGNKRQIKSIKKTFQRELDAMKWADEHPKSPWVKCSERMPELCIEYYDHFGKHLYSIGVVTITSDGRMEMDYYEKHPKFETKTWHKHPFSKDVVAWMPIPEYMKE